MRILKAKDIFPKIYSIVNGEIVKNGNGEYYNKQVAEYVSYLSQSFLVL